MPKAAADKDVKAIGNIMARKPEDLIVVGLDERYPCGKDHPLIDLASNETPVDEAGVNHIDKYGLRKADIIEVIRDGEFLLVVTGRSKVRDACEANKRRVARGEEPRTVPTVVRAGTYDRSEHIRLDISVENWGLRREIKESDKMAQAQKLLDDQTITEEELCLYLGCGKQRLKERLTILKLGAKALSLVDAGKLTPTAAYVAKLHTLTVAEQEERIKTMFADGVKPTVERARRAAGATEIQTPKVRLRKAGEQLQAIAANLDALIGDDAELSAALSTITDLVLGKTWKELTGDVPTE